MFFIVADEGGKPAEIPAGLKVELDLDDAPFLQDESEPEPEAEPQPEPQQADAPLPVPGDDRSEKPKTAKSALAGRLAAPLADRKRLVLIGGAAVLLIVAGVVVNVFLFGKKIETPPKPVYEVVPSKPAAPGEGLKPPYAHLVDWRSFHIESRGEDGGLRFVTCKISIPAESEAQYVELMNRQVVLRDAVYYFLSNRPPELLSSEEKNKALRADIVGVINGHLGRPIKDVYIEEYLVTTP